MRNIRWTSKEDRVLIKAIEKYKTQEAQIDYASRRLYRSVAAIRIRVHIFNLGKRIFS
jgi:hypothetical protein